MKMKMKIKMKIILLHSQILTIFILTLFKINLNIIAI